MRKFLIILLFLLATVSVVNAEIPIQGVISHESGYYQLVVTFDEGTYPYTFIHGAVDSSQGFAGSSGIGEYMNPPTIYGSFQHQRVIDVRIDLPEWCEGSRVHHVSSRTRFIRSDGSTSLWRIWWTAGSTSDVEVANTSFNWGQQVNETQIYNRETTMLRVSAQLSQPSNHVTNNTWLDDITVRFSCNDTLNANFDHDANQQCNDLPVTVQLTDTSIAPEDDPIEAWIWDWREGDSGNWEFLSTDQNPEITFYYPGLYQVMLTIITQSEETDEEIRSIAITECALDPIFYRPLKEGDEQPDQRLFDSSILVTHAMVAGGPYAFYPPLDSASHFSVFAVSNLPGAYVHSISDGYVTSIERLTWDQCAQIGTVEKEDFGSEIITTVLPAYTDQPFCNSQLMGPGYDNPFAVEQFLQFYLDVQAVYVVTIQYQDYDLIYIVRDAPNFVAVGDYIQPKCILGRTIAMDSIPTFDAGFLDGIAGVTVEVVNTAISAAGPGWTAAWAALTSLLSNIIVEPEELINTTDHGVTIISLMSNGEEVSLLPLIGNEYPYADDFCRADPGYEDCITDNPRLMDDGSGWFAQGGAVHWLNPGAIVDPGRTLVQQLSLDPSTEYSLSVLARPVGQPEDGRLTLHLGQTVETLTTDTTQFRTYKLDNDLHEPDAGFFYTAAVANTGSVPIEIASICVTEGDPNLSPGACYFNNSSFDQGTSGWDTGSNVFSLDDGSIVLQFDDYISQNVRLLPEDDGPHTYAVTMSYEAYWTGTPDTDIEFQMEYEWPANEGFIPVGPAVTMANAMTRFSAYWEIEVTEETTGTFTIQPNITLGNSSFVGVRIFEVCLAGPYPGQGGGGEQGPFNPKCTLVSQPQGDGVGEWTLYHWQNLDKFFQCDLMVLLSQQFKMLNNAVNLFEWMSRYNISAFLMYSDWLSTDLFPWLNGHFRNIAIGQVTVTENPGATIWDVLLAIINAVIGPLIDMLRQVVDFILWLAGQAATLLFTVLSALLGVFFWIIIQIFTLFSTLLNFIGSLLGAWNTATPEPIPGLPQCMVAPQSNGFCIGLWFMEHTVFSGRGALFIHLITGVGAIHLMLYVIGTFRKEIRELGKVA